jgi:hypothetical protein
MRQIIRQVLVESIERYTTLSKKYSSIPPEILDRLIEADPKSKVENGEVKFVGGYAQWIINQYLKDNSIVRETNLLRQALTAFDQYKNKLSVRDINQIRSVGELMELIDGLEVNTLTKAQRKEQALIRDVEKKGETENWLILSPRTEEASIALAGPPLTQWCTSCIGKKEDPNQFNTYHNTHELIIFCSKQHIVPTGKGAGRPRPVLQLQTYQVWDTKLHIKKVGYEIMDSRKKRGSLEQVLSMIPELKPWLAEYFKESATEFLTDETEMSFFMKSLYEPNFG